MSEWIAVSDRLPDEMQRVICSGFIFNNKAGGRYVSPSTFSDGTFYGYTEDDDGEDGQDFDEAGEMHSPTHWQPLPAPPTE